MTVFRKFDKARLKYNPKTIKCLFIAESPPEIGSCRFFYFEDVFEGDSLFIEMMKVLYLPDNPNISLVRLQKREYLRRFQNDGFYLIDAVDEPTGVKGTSRKVRKIRESLPDLGKKVHKLVDDKTLIILISRPVYNATYQYLRSSGFNVINEEMIDFPGSTGQPKFREKLSRLLEKFNLLG